MKRTAISGMQILPALLISLLGFPPSSQGYSVLSHEAIIDAVWRTEIRKILLERYPTAIDAQLREAHAYAYGGCIIQDMGYYPFGDRFFSDLTHYVRSGDFIQAMLQQSQNMYEYAFALGALAHFAADNVGHPMAVNRSVPLIYPKLRLEYGDVVTFGDDPKAHVLVEFSFDVVQIAGSGYQPATYHNFIGFKVAKPLLERAFQTTYGLNFKDLFESEDLAIGTYRRAASEVIPEMTVLAWRKKKKEIRSLTPTATRRAFVFKLSRRQYEAEWGEEYIRPRFLHRVWGRVKPQPTVLARILVFLFQLLPKVGRLQTLSFRIPTPETERLFVKSFDTTVERYREELKTLDRGQLRLANEDFDTGKPTRAGEYKLADETYAELVDRLARNRFRAASPELRANILSFYVDPSAPNAAKDDKGRWEKVLRELDELKVSAGSPAATPPHGASTSAASPAGVQSP